MLQSIQNYLGATRIRLLFILFVATGLFNLVLTLFLNENEWVDGVQTILFVLFILGSVIIIGSKLPRQTQLRWLAILAPSFGLILLGTVFFSDQLKLFMGGAFGWVLAGLFIFRSSRAPTEYKQAIRHLRKNEYADAVKVMDGLIREEPEDAYHYKFRAELLRLWGKLGRAKRDYQKMIELLPDSPIGYNGLSEVSLQAGQLGDALDAAEKTVELAPKDWTAWYNLGMVQDRLEQSQPAIENLQQAIALKVPDARHRLLIHLYLYRAYTRLNKTESANQAIDEMKKHQKGLHEWETILENEQAETLREILAHDIQIAKELIQ